MEKKRSDIILSMSDMFFSTSDMVFLVSHIALEMFQNVFTRLILAERRLGVKCFGFGGK